MEDFHTSFERKIVLKNDTLAKQTSYELSTTILISSYERIKSVKEPSEDSYDRNFFTSKNHL